MQIAVFTNNQARHIALIEELSKIASKVYAIQECNTVFPGMREDFFKKSKIMQKYFLKVIEAEKKLFGKIRFTSDNVTQLVLKSGDLSLLDLEILEPALKSDFIIVFGSSYIKEPLVDILIEKNTLNIHMGISPYYRGSSCNFWALYDKNPELVGATVHLLSKGLDSGDILYHAFPPSIVSDPFLFGMYAVKSVHQSLIQYIKTGKIFSFKPVKQDKNLEIRYTKNRDFTDEVAEEFLNNIISIEYIKEKCVKRNLDNFVNPFVLKE